jgi:hypothetical protein
MCELLWLRAGAVDKMPRVNFKIEEELGSILCEVEEWKVWVGVDIRSTGKPVNALSGIQLQ